MSKRFPSGPARVITGRTHQVSVRIPHDLYAALAARGPIAAQLVEAARDAPRLREEIERAQQECERCACYCDASTTIRSALVTGPLREVDFM